MTFLEHRNAMTEAGREELNSFLGTASGELEAAADGVAIALELMAIFGKEWSTRDELAEWAASLRLMARAREQEENREMSAIMETIDVEPEDENASRDGSG